MFVITLILVETLLYFVHMKIIVTNNKLNLILTSSRTKDHKFDNKMVILLHRGHFENGVDRR